MWAQSVGACIAFAQALGDASERRLFEQKLRDHAGSRFGVVKQARVAEADRRAMDMLATAGQKLMPVGGRGVFSWVCICMGRWGGRKAGGCAGEGWLEADADEWELCVCMSVCSWVEEGVKYFVGGW